MNIPLIICSVILATMVVGALMLRNRMRASKNTGTAPRSTMRWFCAMMALVLLGIVGQVVAYANRNGGDRWTDPLFWTNMVLAGMGIGILAAFGPFQTLRTARTDKDTDKEQS